MSLLEDAMYRDRKGKAITPKEWAELNNDRAQKVVKQETTPTGYWVSTVWLGLNHSFGAGPGRYFETMVFVSEDNLTDMECDRYATEEEALKGHARMVKRWSSREKEARAQLTGDRDYLDEEE